MTLLHTEIDVSAGELVHVKLSLDISFAQHGIYILGALFLWEVLVYPDVFLPAIFDEVLICSKS